MSGTSLASSHKDKARGAVKEAFDVLKNNVTSKTPKSASVILEKFNKVMIDLKNTLKKERKAETILGKYLKNGKITDVKNSPISRAVKDFLSRKGDVFVKRAFVTYADKIASDISTMQGDVNTKLSKCKRLKSADVLAAIYHVTYEEDSPVLRLLILGEMFTELGKANGFIKGNSEGEAETPEKDKAKKTEGALDEAQNNQDGNKATDKENDPKDNKNKHLGTLATKEIRDLAATIGKGIRELMKNKEWLKKEMGNTINYGAEPTKVSPKGQNAEEQSQTEIQTNPTNVQEEQTIAISELQKRKAMKKYAGKNPEPALPKELAPRKKEQGKYVDRPIETTENLQKFLADSKNAIRIKHLKNCVNDAQAFKTGLNQPFKIGNKETNMRMILNTLADIVYKDNNLPAVVNKLDGNPVELTDLLQLVKKKLELSHDGDDDRKTLNLTIKDWVAVINVVNVCTKTIQVTYNSDEDYATMFAKEVDKLKNTKINVVTADGGKLEEKAISEILTGQIDVKNLIKLETEHKKRLTSLQVGYKPEIEYDKMYNAIYAFINTPNEENLDKAGIKMVTADTEKEITEAKWTKSKTFDDFVANAGNAISQIAEKQNNQIKLPPLNNASRDPRLVLSANGNAYANFDAKKEWFNEVDKETCNDIVKNITVEEYLGTNIDLLKALKDENGEQYVLGIKLDDFVKSWTDLALEQLGKTPLNANKNFTDDTGEHTINLENGLTVSARLANEEEEEEGYTLEKVNAFVDFVSKNSSKDFCNVEGITGEDNWGNLMTGKSSFIIEQKENDQHKKPTAIKENGKAFEYDYGEENVETPKEEEKKENKEEQGKETETQNQQQPTPASGGTAGGTGGTGGTGGDDPK